MTNADRHPRRKLDSGEYGEPFSPSVNRLIGSSWLGRVLYPELFPEDLRPIVREFYTRFYHQAPTERQLNELLAGAEPSRR